LDIRQEEIATLHDLCVDEKILKKHVADMAEERPVCVIMPMLFNEIKNNVLGNILKQLNKCTYLREVIIPLAAKSEEEFSQVKRFFKTLELEK